MSFKSENYSDYDIAIMETTHACQCNCPGCYMHEDNLINDKSSQLTLDQAQRIVDLSKEYKGREIAEVQLVGGEPLLWKDLKEFIEIVKERGIDIQIYTNMIALNPELAEILMQNSVKITGKLDINPDGDASQIQTQARMIGKSEGMAKRMIDGIKHLKEAGYDESLFRLNNLVRKDNIQFTPDFYRWCLKNNVGADFELMSCGGEIDDDYWKISPSTQQIADLIKELQEVQHDIGISEAGIAMPHIFYGCAYYRNQLYFALNGDIKACSASDQISLANINEPNAIKKARNSEIILARNNLTQALVGEPCNTCDTWNECLGGCRITAESKGDYCSGYEICPKPYLD